VVLAKARTSFFIDHSIGFSFVNTVAEARWRSGSAKHTVSFANRKPRAPKPLSDIIIAWHSATNLGTRPFLFRSQPRSRVSYWLGARRAPTNTHTLLKTVPPWLNESFYLSCITEWLQIPQFRRSLLQSIASIEGSVTCVVTKRGWFVAKRLVDWRRSGKGGLTGPFLRGSPSQPQKQDYVQIQPSEQASAPIAAHRSRQAGSNLRTPSQYNHWLVYNVMSTLEAHFPNLPYRYRLQLAIIRARFYRMAGKSSIDAYRLHPFQWGKPQ